MIAAEAEKEALIARARARLPPGMTWPVPFERAGAAYVLDPASNYFYEASSGAYYDPKTKLYFFSDIW